MLEVVRGGDGWWYDLLRVVSWTRVLCRADAAEDGLVEDLGGRRIANKKFRYMSSGTCSCTMRVKDVRVM